MFPTVQAVSISMLPRVSYNVNNPEINFWIRVSQSLQNSEVYSRQTYQLTEKTKISVILFYKYEGNTKWKPCDDVKGKC